MKKILLVLCGLLLAVSLGACGEEPTRSTPAPVDSGERGNAGSSQPEASGGRLEPSRAESFSQAEELSLIHI